MRCFVIAFMALAMCSDSASAQATAFKTGERTTGNTKQCYYQFAGNTYTRTVQSYQLCPISIQVRSGSPTPAPSRPAPTTVTAFKTGEQTTGNTKQCYYQFAGNTYTRTVQSYQLCPISIQVRSK
jgi:hypothetical protein